MIAIIKMNMESLWNAQSDVYTRTTYTTWSYYRGSLNSQG